jgi:hypothetical protein
LIDKSNFDIGFGFGARLQIRKSGTFNKGNEGHNVFQDISPLHGFINGFNSLGGGVGELAVIEGQIVLEMGSLSSFSHSCHVMS